MTVIGIPRATLYHKYGVLWDTFFSDIGCTIVHSPPTDRRILARGVELAVDESCLPMKVLLGHVATLAGSCDAVLVPRLERLLPHEEACVKFMGAYDVVHNTMPQVPLVTYEVAVHNGLRERDQLIRLGVSLGSTRKGARRAYAEASMRVRDSRQERLELQQQLLDQPKCRPRLLVVGHPYNLYDPVIGGPVLDFLATQDVDVLVSDDVDHALAHQRSTQLSPGLIWTFSKELLGAVELYRRLVDGIIFMVTFPCGPDSLMAELAQRRLGSLPVATLVLDELSGEGGLRTRLESFVDILRMRTAS